jgi:hypothetical protein
MAEAATAFANRGETRGGVQVPAFARGGRALPDRAEDTDPAASADQVRVARAAAPPLSRRVALDT